MEFMNVNVFNLNYNKFNKINMEVLPEEAVENADLVK